MIYNREIWGNSFVNQSKYSPFYNGIFSFYYQLLPAVHGTGKSFFLSERIISFKRIFFFYQRSGREGTWKKCFWKKSLFWKEKRLSMVLRGCELTGRRDPSKHQVFPREYLMFWCLWEGKSLFPFRKDFFFQRNIFFYQWSDRQGTRT